MNDKKLITISKFLSRHLRHQPEAAAGLHKMKRHHVHLSFDVAIAVKVGQRHGKPVVFMIDASAMRAKGHPFFRSANGVWLTEHVPAEFLRLSAEKEWQCFRQQRIKKADEF